MELYNENNGQRKQFKRHAAFLQTRFLPRTIAHWTSNACQPQTKILTLKNIIFHCCLCLLQHYISLLFMFIVIYVLVSDESVYAQCHVDYVTSIAICAKSFLFEIKLSLIGSVPGIAANCGPTVQSVDLGRGEWNDPFIIIIVRSSRTWNGTAPGRVPNLGKIICQYF